MNNVKEERLSVLEYTVSKKLTHIPFKALIAAALQHKDFKSGSYMHRYYALTETFPGIRDDIEKRSKMPCGILHEELKIDLNPDDLNRAAKMYYNV